MIMLQVFSSIDLLRLSVNLFGLEHMLLRIANLFLLPDKKHEFF
jgi:hypothetical protein